MISAGVFILFNKKQKFIIYKNQIYQVLFPARFCEYLLGLLSSSSNCPFEIFFFDFINHDKI
jgi:hypothetical protein